MYKVFVKGNYFYIERISDGRIFEGHKKNVLVSSLTETSEIFCIWNINGTINLKNELDVADLVDENSVPFTVATFRAFIEENTGNFNSGGGSAPIGPTNRVFNYFADDYTDLTTNIALTPVDGEIAMVRNAQGTAWLPYNLGGTYFPKGAYIYDGANWIPNTDLITQQLEINIDDINDLETEVANSQYKVKVDAADTTGNFLEDKLIDGPQISWGKTLTADKKYIAGIVDGSVTNVKFQDVSGPTIKGRAAAGVGGISDLTPAEVKTILDLSGTNTGDETTASIQTKRPLKTIEGQSLEGAGNIDLQKSDVGLGNVDNTSDANKPVSIATQNALDNKVDKVAGKQLSDENYTLSEKNKLAGIQAGAEVNVQSDWNEANPASDAFILNKPTLSNVNISDIAISQGNLIQSILTVPTLTATVNNWNPAGFNANTDLIRVDVNANNRQITGIIAPAVGLNRILAIKNLNNAGLDIRFSNNNAGSSAENRFLCRDNNNKSIKPNEIALWFYDHIQQRWTPFNRIG